MDCIEEVRLRSLKRLSVLLNRKALMTGFLKKGFELALSSRHESLERSSISEMLVVSAGIEWLEERLVAGLIAFKGLESTPLRGREDSRGDADVSLSWQRNKKKQWLCRGNKRITPKCARNTQ